MVALIILIIVDNDYNTGPYTITIGAGENSATFVISIIDDNIHEQLETFYLTIDGSSLPNGVNSNDRATVTIFDDNGKWLVLATGLPVFWFHILYFVWVSQRDKMSLFSIK